MAYQKYNLCANMYMRLKIPFRTDLVRRKLERTHSNFLRVHAQCISVCKYIVCVYQTDSSCHTEPRENTKSVILHMEHAYFAQYRCIYKTHAMPL